MGSVATWEPRDGESPVKSTGRQGGVSVSGMVRRCPTDLNIYTGNASRDLISFPPNRNYPKCGVKRTSSPFSGALRLAGSLCSTGG